MHKHTTSIIAAVIRRRLQALLALGLVLGLVGCVTETYEPASADEPTASELTSVEVDDELVLDEDFDLEAPGDGETADAVRRTCRTGACDPGYFCCNTFCIQVTPGVRCVDRSGRDTI
jgi:hypothetical protein